MTSESNVAGFRGHRMPGHVDHLLNLALSQASRHALVLLDLEGRIIGWLAGAQHIFGYTHDEIIGRPSADLFTPEDNALDLPEHERAVARSHSAAEDDRWMMRKDGTRIWVVGALYALREAQGGLAGYCKVMRDMTDIKAHIVTLEKRAETLQETESHRSAFTGTIAHEFGNTFASFDMALNLMRRDLANSSSIAHYFEPLQHQVSLMQRLVEDLKQMTRIGAGQMQLHKERLELNDVLHHAAEACRPAFQQRRQQFHMLVHSGVIAMEADPLRLHEIFVNLLNNASKYTPEEGNIWLKVTTEGKVVTIKVEDDGIGIGAEMLPRIFDMFTQASTAVAQSPGGLGIGLWLVKNLVTLHGGTIGVRSEGEGHGCEFSVRLPILQASPDA